jgi:biotin carboxyl carrier protein
MIRALLLALALIVVGAVVLHEYRSHAEAGEAATAFAGGAPSSRMGEVEGQAAIVLDSAAARRVDLGLAVVRAAREAVELELTGELIADPAGVSVVRAPVSGRLSSMTGHSWPAYGAEVRTGEEIAQVSDARPLVVARGGTVSRVSAQPGELVQAGQELIEITDYAHPLARIAWRAEAPLPPPRELTLLRAPGGPRARATLVGPAPAADALTRQEAFLYRAEHAWPGARPGALLLALLADSRGPRRAALVPRAAVVQWEGLTWAFVQHGPGRYVRTRVSTERPVPDGWLVGSGIKPGDTVVVRGAEQLLSEEFRARITVGEEVGE